ncbi:MAG: pirin family protein [Planctomycetes bacterium]|nr:pirin family protein [Planctomycetota bacterium]MCB9909933.1 pirin family protein [Planctomycetota bacterium]MCB9912930.1 pirin family protein [Planctomycetota bacterium]HPF12746.1 pirin family protein [Planctomycetota bacterium]HRV79824.1 pirin family protein [Planctomycetota bacterium]
MKTTPNLQILRSADRGHADHGWLDAHHTFSFAGYFDPERMGFGSLRVLNQDRVAAGEGFGTHGHRDMEIVTYVLDGTLEHKDSMGNGSQMRPGEVQFMSAGRGVTHSEFNPSKTEPLHLLQMWVLPRESGFPPRYEQKTFEESERRGRNRLVVSPDGSEGSLTIGADARMYAGLADGDEVVTYELPKDRMAWLHLAKGEVTVAGERLLAGDGAAITAPGPVEFRDGVRAEWVLWELPLE